MIVFGLSDTSCDLSQINSWNKLNTDNSVKYHSVEINWRTFKKRLAHLSTRNIKMFLFWSDSIHHSMKISKKEWILIKLYFSFFFNFWKLSNLLSFGSPLAPVIPWFGISCYVDSGTHDIRLDLSRSFYLCKFSFVVHAKCFSPAFCMNYEAKFAEVKQGRWVKLEFTCSWI